MRRWKCHLENGLQALRAATVGGLAALAIGGACSGTTLAEDAVFSSKARFRIPYQLDAAEIRRLQAEEIQLHVSTNNGREWRHVDSVPPVEGKFTFEATQDGEYWFSVRTVSEDGRHHPSGRLAAGLKVHVDTSAPTLNLELSEPSPGQVSLSWSSDDDNLDVESLVLDYRDTEYGDWQTIHVVSTQSGQTNWSVPGGGMVSVRGQVKDRAGNKTTQQSRVEVTGAAAPQMPAAPAVRRPVATNELQESPETTDPFVKTPGPRIQGTTGLPTINPNGGEYSQFVSQQATHPQPATHPQLTGQPAFSKPAPRPMMPVSARQAAYVRRVSSNNFQIGYAVDDVGPSGVSSIDLYLTEDQGRKWFHYGVDEDGVSPFEVTVPQDGTYGFAIRVRSGVGLAQAPPQPGDAPEVMVSVDREPPQVALQPLKQGHGQLPNQVLIEWTMQDEQLAERPVSLYYAPRAGGPWQPITGWEPNTGQFRWTIGPDAPRQIFIRLEARDAAGNIARVESPEPLMIDLSRPTARIIDVESMSTRH